MKIDDFMWLPTIVEKLDSKHGVSPEEAEEVFFNKPRFLFVETGLHADEDVYSASGRTNSGRYMVVFFIRKESNTALIISARDMDRKERKRYERK
ncbi:conserved protein of unknown function [Candidatus Promineifilum breve]|uniref:BrnT family toxin n=1 Tax=Candidatus Promineifilum breve TaxID=1806508 RepID=A0A160T1A1_9CHLR|nr:BrnT family toxin [Candidatus Promineifilum breve]CUS03242.2 conserved protein of unknown function [Candidatus Promineifilum breve]